MTFEKAKNAVKALVAGSVALCLIDLFFVPEGTEISAYIALGSIACLTLAIVFIFSFCKCPYCGKRIALGLFKVTHCPSCRRDLVTGERKKGKGGKRNKY